MFFCVSRFQDFYLYFLQETQQSTLSKPHITRRTHATSPTPHTHIQIYTHTTNTTTRNKNNKNTRKKQNENKNKHKKGEPRLIPRRGARERHRVNSCNTCSVNDTIILSLSLYYTINMNYTQRL